MEKTLSPDERIRRAEEIYYRRKNQDINRKSAKVNVSSKKNFGMFKKMIFQISICVVIYVIFYIVQSSSYIFSEDVIQKVKEVLSYDINIKNSYVECIKYINDLSKNVGATIGRPQEENLIESNGFIDNKINEDNMSENLEIQNANSVEEQNIGGENTEVVDGVKKEEPISQMEQDAKDILQTKSLTIPLKGTITSRFGLREPQTPTVPKNHTGIDIAANEGTVFIAAMSGLVEEVSSERRFRESF